MLRCLHSASTGKTNITSRRCDALSAREMSISHQQHSCTIIPHTLSLIRQHPESKVKTKLSQAQSFLAKCFVLQQARYTTATHKQSHTHTHRLTKVMFQTLSFLRRKKKLYRCHARMQEHAIRHVGMHTHARLSHSQTRQKTRKSTGTREITHQSDILLCEQSRCLHAHRIRDRHNQACRIALRTTKRI